MSTDVTVRYESSLYNFLTQPLEIGLRHLKVACCDGSQETLLQMAKERIIYRPFEKDNNIYPQLRSQQRLWHATIGLSEIVGYTALLVSDLGYKRFIIPFIISTADCLFNRHWLDFVGGLDGRIHHQEGAKFRSSEENILRRNPFGSKVIADPFYQGASWFPKRKFPMTSSNISELILKAENFSNHEAKHASEHFDRKGLSKEEYAKQHKNNLLNYIKNVLEDQNFQKDPQAFMYSWNSKKSKFPENYAHTFLENAVFQIKD